MDVTVSRPRGLDGEPKLIAPMALEAMTDFVVGEGIATADEVAAIVGELYRLAADPAVLMGTPRIVHAWGRVA